MRKIFVTLCLTALLSNAWAQTEARWIRKSSISPDGKTIAFCYQGDIFTVPACGGTARQLTTNPAHDSDPMWSPDGKSIIFTSYREDSKDIWVMPSCGGAPTRLTTYGGGETPLAVTPDGKVLYTAAIQSTPETDMYAGSSQVYSVNLDGGRSKLLLPLQIGNASVNKAGVMLYEEIKGYEDPMRKHHTSSVARDIWKMEGGKFTRLTDFKGEDRNPVFAADGDSFYFLSERDGSFNIYKSSLREPQQAVKISSFTTHPARYLSIASDGTLCCSWNGDLYTIKEGEDPVKVDVNITKDRTEKEMSVNRVLGASYIAPSPNGKEVAVISRGDVYVANIDASSTRRITNTPQAERNVSFSDDGRTLYYASERDGEWAIWRSSLKNKNDKYFSVAFEFEEERFTPKGQTCFQPQVSPDGKWVAYLRDRSEIVIRSTSGSKEKVLLPKSVNYSYQDGDLDFSWSPDSKSILTDYMADGGWNNTDVALIDVESGKITNLTQSGYSDGNFKWALGGKAMTWTTDKQGFRSHGSWGAQRDVYAMFFDAAAYDDFQRSASDDKVNKLFAAEDKKDKKDSTAKKDSVKAKVKAVKLDLEGREYRTLRLTPLSGSLADYVLSADGTKLYYVMKLEKSNDLCCLDIKEGSIKVVKKGFSHRFVLSPDGKSVYYPGLLGISKMDLSSGKTSSVSFSGEQDYYPAKERQYIFEHCWKQVNEKFYDPSLHGVDWKAMHDNYESFLPYITDNFEFSEMLSEMLGELNASHTGCRYRGAKGVAPGRIGVIYDTEYTGKGLKIAEVLPGGILSIVAPDVKAGDVITAIDGKDIAAGTQWYDAFARKAGKKVYLSIDCKGAKDINVMVKTGSSDSDLLYARWVKQREQMVEKLSGGRIGYVHVKGMNSPSFREVYSKALGKYRSCDAIIVDTRHNGGGWLHDDLATLLSGQKYIEWRPRGQYIGDEPYSKWNKPSCVLTGEDNYSDASGFPYVYKTLGLGKIIGAPVPGTMTAVWWETQVDSDLVFGIPQVTSWGLKEDRPLENLQIEPDIEVYNTPESLLEGKDLQIEAAVAELMKTIK